MPAAYEISDLAGYDLLDHDGQPAAVIKRVASWLGKQEFTMNMPTSQAVLDAYPGFCQRLTRPERRLSAI